MKVSNLVARPATASVFLAVIVAGGILVARGPDVSQGATPPAGPIPVAVQTLTPQHVQIWAEFSGRLHAVDSAEIKPEVSGRITEVRFEDGQNVTAGDILFVIDPRPYEAAVAKAQANLASARTNAGFAKLEQDRAAGLMHNQAIARQVFDERANSSRVATAAVQEAEASLRQASLDLEHAYVRAPITGRASRAEITLGNLVQAGPGAPLLTTVVANHSIYADFDVDEQTYLHTIRDQDKIKDQARDQVKDQARDQARDQERRIPVELSVSGDRDHLYRGTIYSFDNRLDATSGTIRARAKFDNADAALVPGMFVTVRLASETQDHALLVPTRALGFDQNKQFVFVVGDGNKVAYREVELGMQVQSQRVALKGLQAGDRIIVDGIQHVLPEVVVDPHEVTPITVSSASDTAK
ncbi:MAG: efflux RND transporter periplasmic adaptor subunit [Azospirillaceae bacterium]|nr:efflux RND transporter periplasmic adaptor subunit [Azospirillaceae bacterium]